MGFLSSILAKVIEWLLVLCGTYLYEKATKFVDEQKKKKINEENEKSYKKSLDEKNAEERKKAARKLLNGEK